MSKHTPGPWYTTARSNNMIDVCHQIRRPGAITMALCRVQARQSWLSEAEANARLIAAAPDLLEALKRCAGVLGLVSPGGQEDPDVLCARAAIAKATGEPQL